MKLSGKFKKAMISTLLAGSALFGAACESQDHVAVCPGSDPVISLSRDFNSASGVSPVLVAPSVMTYGMPTWASYYLTTFTHTAYFNASQLSSSHSYKYEGVLDANGKVCDRVYIYGSVSNINLSVTNAQLTVSGDFAGKNQITLDFPCYEETSMNGVVSKVGPRAPFDKTPALKADSMSGTTTINAPSFTKIQIGSNSPTTI